MTIIFFGSDPWFSSPVLDALIKAGHDAPIVITKGQGLRAKGQGNIKFLQADTPEDIAREKLQKAWSSLPSSLGPHPLALILAAFGPPFLPDDLLDWPTYGCLNVHASLLPRWRGASPVPAAIAAGDRETGVSIMKMTRDIDRGPIMGQARVKIYQPNLEKSDPATWRGRTFLDAFDTRESLTRRLAVLGGELIVETLQKLENNQIKYKNQPEKNPTPYTHRLTKESGRIDWRLRPGETDLKQSQRVERFIRAVSPWPGATTSIKYQVVSSKGKQEKTIREVKILKAHLESARTSFPPATSCLSLVADFIQLPGKNPVTWAQFLAGHPEASFF